MPDVHFTLQGVAFVWNSDKDARNQRQHGIDFYDS